jgi:putative hemin transport protein
MQTNVLEKTQALSLAGQWVELKKAQPGLRIRDAASQLGVSEAELLVTGLGKNVTRLRCEMEPILKSLKPFGELMALTRNDYVVHERKGVYDNVSTEHHGSIGLVVNPDIDLRLFLGHWKHAFAVTEEARGKLRQSIQFFDKTGMAIHKIYLTDNSDASHYEGLVAAFIHDDQESLFTGEAVAPQKPPLPDSMIDLEAFRTDWRALKDTHDFFLLLKKHKVAREQALRLSGEEFAYRLKDGALRATLERAAARTCEIMIFVGNIGCVQIHTGPVTKLVEHGGFYNVLDEQFNLHAKEEAIANAWVTLKPTVDGLVTGVECYDKEGEMIVQLFGKRKPGIPELLLWRELVADLPRG